MCRPAILKTIDPNRFGGISPNFSTIHALISMTQWEQATGGTSAAVRTVLLDYTNAFDSGNASQIQKEVNEIGNASQIQKEVNEIET